MKKNYLKFTGPNLWKRAKKIIPGGSMLFSKKSEMFLYKNWPSYFSKSKKCYVWDLHDKKFLDMIFAVGACTLGYSNPKIDNFVIKKIIKGNMTTLNAPEEVYLAEKLIEIHPWAKMVKFARTGGEANSIAVRIARAASGKDGVAFCGYHGWHDWYLSSNIKTNNSLNDHLMNGLEIAGVPKVLKNTTFPFLYNDIHMLKKIIRENKIGVIKMEVKRNLEPQNNFLQKVRELATRNNIVLIFDECTSGFRETYGGIHKKYDVNPDIAMFGKAIGNGYALTAVIGKKEVMSAAQKTFISSTFWTERVGSVAALQTIKLMKEISSWKIITEIGKKVIKGWKDLSSRYNIDITITGSTGIPSFIFSSEKHIVFKTYLTKKMLSKGILASNIIYISVAHTPSILKLYFYELEKVFYDLSKYDFNYIKNQVKHDLCTSDFKRIN